MTLKELYKSLLKEFEGKGAVDDNITGSMDTADEESIDDAFARQFPQTQSSINSIYEQEDIDEEQPPGMDKEEMMGQEYPLQQQADPNTVVADPNIQDPNMIGQDPNQMLMPGEEPPKSLFDIGRMYELKKIYYRLVSLKEYLSGNLDSDLLKLRNIVSSSAELFRTLIDNFQSFEDKQIDDIIVLYYKFLERLYEVLDKYYKKENREENNENKGDIWNKIVKMDKADIQKLNSIVPSNIKEKK